MDDSGIPTATRTTAPEQGYALKVSDRAIAAMQLAAHFTAESMHLSTTADPRERLAEQLSYFDLAFRAIMGSTARGMIKATGPISEGEAEHRARTITGDLR
jgi:hypothetical protein